MPVAKWEIEPARLVSPKSFNNKHGYSGTELTDAINASLASVIRQLGCLARNTEMIFSELEQESCRLFDRASKLNNRVVLLKEYTSHLNPVVDEVSLEQVSMNKPFHSARSSEQTLAARPEAINQQYIQAAPPPALEKLNSLTGKDCLKLYTNPDFFFELWCRQIQQEVEQKKKGIRKRQQPKKVDEIVVPVRKKVYEGVDKEFRNDKAVKKPQNDSSSNSEVSRSSSQSSSSSNQNDGVQMRRQAGPGATSPPSPLTPKPTSVSRVSKPIGAPPPPPPGVSPAVSRLKNVSSEALPTPPPTPMPAPPPLSSTGGQSHPDCDDDEDDILPPPPTVVVRPTIEAGRQNRLSRISTLPPPPMSIYLGDAVTDSSNDSGFPLPPPAINRTAPTAQMPHPPPLTGSLGAPPPPPPPAPPLNMNIAPPPPPPPAMESGFSLRSAAPAATSGAAPARNNSIQQSNRASRGDLLKAIRQGMQLRKVEEKKEQDKNANTANSSTGGIAGLFDVSKILEIRRQALENDDESDQEDDEWDD